MPVLLLIITFVFYSIASLYYVWLFQLNGYYFKRTTKQLVSSLGFKLSFIFSLMQIVINLISLKVAVYTNLIFAIGLAPFVFLAKKTPLKLTSRVIRWGFVNFVILGATIYFLESWCLPVALLPIVVLSNVVLMPLQWGINTYYLKKAQRKILKMKSKIIVVTGSYGKTSTKTILNAFLQTKYRCACTPSSFNTPLGIAKFINGLKSQQDFLIIEAGAKKQGDVATICKLFAPSHAIITGVTMQHMETFGNLQNIIKTKGEVLKSLPNDAICVLNADDENSREYFESKNLKILSISKTKGDYCYSNVDITPEGTNFLIIHQDKIYKVFTPLLGGLNAQNICVAFALAKKLGCSTESLVQKAKELDYVPHRLQLLRKNDLYILDDGYNANILGMDGFIEVLSCFNCTKAVVTQGIVEMGSHDVESNFRFAKKLAKVADCCALIGQNTSSLYKGLTEGGFDEEKLFVCDSLDEAVSKLAIYLTNGGLIAFQNDLPDNMLAQKRSKK